MDNPLSHLLRPATAVASAFLVLLAHDASALLIAYDGFDYAAGNLKDQNGGTGDWADKWKGDDKIDVILGGNYYIDSVPNLLTSVGNHVELEAGQSTIKKVDRSLRLRR